MSVFNEHPIIVTGGASGIGRAITERLAAEQARVAIFDLNGASAAAVADELKDQGLSLFAYAVDITDYDAVADAVTEFEAESGPVYGLVNNAGWDEAISFVDSQPSFWNKVIDINLIGPLNVTHVVSKRMRAEGRGRVVSIASDAGRVGSSGEAVYSAAKGGIIALMKTLAREFARQGVTFNSVCPGPTDTPLLASFNESSGGKLAPALERAIPMQRLAQPSDFPGIVSYFLSAEAGYVTGQTISISGGLSMHG
ncbi:MAG: SDR family oxidoreductase [Gammaproteobacteria bacterium]|nr:SDR family oxidoreductase [Gammaproteobacteria bacterium]